MQNAKIFFFLILSRVVLAHGRFEVFFFHVGNKIIQIIST